LARAEKDLGLAITDAQIAEMESHLTDIDYEYAAQKEKELRHDVMAHVHTFGEVCPLSFPIIHLGATSCYVGDNTDIILMREGLVLIRQKLLRVIARLSGFADKYKALPTLGFTHFQPAQLTTVGKRSSLWINELMMDLSDLDYRLSSLKLLGQKGTTGTQASFLELFDGDGAKVDALEDDIAKSLGFEACVPVSGQTYSRKVDANVLYLLSSIAQSAYKFSNDLRLLQSFKEMEEPFEKEQVGSSAMAYKRNPMRSERMGALCRYVVIDGLNPAITASTQWFERTLDDSANRRISIAEGFLAADAILNIYMNVADGLVVYPKSIRQRIMRELPFMATENILMDAVKRGGDRQTLHEKIRRHSVAAAKVVKEEGGENDLIGRIASDPSFGLTREDLDGILQPEKYVGRAPQQTEKYLQKVVHPVLKQYETLLGETYELSV
jgi:adenylosuccinate lyase